MGLTSCRFGLLVDLTRRGLEAHLQHTIFEVVVAEQLDAFETTLRERLTHHIKRITIGHVTHVNDVLKLRDEINVQVCVDCQAVGL